MNRLEQILAIDEILIRLAMLRESSSDLPTRAEFFDQEWKQYDERRQRLRVLLTQDEDIEYEVTIHAKK